MLQRHKFVVHFLSDYTSVLDHFASWPTQVLLPAGYFRVAAYYGVNRLLNGGKICPHLFKKERHNVFVDLKNCLQDVAGLDTLLAVTQRIFLGTL